MHSFTTQTGVAHFRLNLTEVQTARMAFTQKAVLSPVALQPEIQEGYWYKKKSTSGIETTYRYDKIESCEFGQCIAINSSEKDNMIITTDYRNVRIENANGTWTKFSPTCWTNPLSHEGW